METVRDLGGGFNESACVWKNSNNRSISNKPRAINFFDELTKVMKSIAGNANKFKHFPQEFRWINDIWKTSGHRTQPARLKLKPDASNDWGLFDAELTLKTLHNTSWLNHPRWNRTKICLGQLLKSLKAKISELERVHIRNNRIHASSSITVLACFFS